VAAGPVLVIACGLGDDAEELASRGWTVTAFDVSSTAIDWCHRRFPDSSVDYHAADLFALPPAWRQVFDLVVEIRTLQSIEPARRTVAMQAVAACVRPGGYAFVHCLLGEEAAPLPESPPHPLTLAELRAFEEAGLVLVTCAEGETADGRGRSVTLAYRRSQ